ncbi:homoserine dehydrogenase [Alkalibacillus silvisoli]|uniref:Homoserine dehydrogenase n=1 Tax=Alkalibacillus silvisoli TaxID=392823 RepID=A0ABN0ZLT3_9BACI
MSSINVALLGFGTVGRGVYEIIEQEQKRLTEILGCSVNIVAILVDDETIERNVPSHILVTSSAHDVLTQPVDVVIEAIVGVEPAYTYLSQAIEKGCHIITANKEMFAHKGHELKQQAKERQVSVEYEATVAGGVPVINTLRQLVTVNRVVQIEAILNGTTNYILSEITNKQASFAEALQSAQQLGYAEADPTNDLKGYDALYKAIILAELLTGTKVYGNHVFREGIKSVIKADVIHQQLKGSRVKHIATLNFGQGQIDIRVEPKWITSEHPLYHVEGVDNAIVMTGDYVGRLKLEGPGAGQYPTASVMVEDLVKIFSRERKLVNN